MLLIKSNLFALERFDFKNTYRELIDQAYSYKWFAFKTNEIIIIII